MLKIIILRGPAGVGKSTVAELLQKKLGENWVHLDIDKIKHTISETSSPIRSEIAHRVGKYFIEELLSNNFNIIVEEIFRENFYKELLSLIERSHSSVHKFFLRADINTLITRNASRVKIKDHKTIQDLHSEIQPLEGEKILETSNYSTEQLAELIIKDLS